MPDSDDRRLTDVRRSPPTAGAARHEGSVGPVGGLVLVCVAFVCVALLSVAILCRFGGHYRYGFVWENRRGEAVVVSVLANEISLRPCSVRATSEGGIPYGYNVPIEVADESGEVVYRTSIKQSGEGFPSFHIVIPPDGVDHCPPPADSFTLSVWNDRGTQIQLWRDDTMVGTVSRRDHAHLGPFGGTWEDAYRMTVRTVDGQQWMVRNLAPHLDFDIGEVPEIQFGVSGL